jgi:hypothetical protein
VTRFEDPFALALEANERATRATGTSVLFIGDSLSVGTVGAMLGAAADVGASVPTIELPGKPGGRRAVEVTPAGGRAWFDPATHGAVWLALGTNDLAGNADDARRGWVAFETLARAAATWGAPLTIGSVPPLRNREAQAAAWSTAAETLAGELGASFARVHEAAPLSALPDGVHPSNYRPLARAWLTASRPGASAPGGAGGGALALLAVVALVYLSR